MARKKFRNKTYVDFDIGIGEIIPSTQEAYIGDTHLQTIRKEEKTSLKNFKNIFLRKIEDTLKGTNQFPTEHEVFIFIIQYFVSNNEYKSRDVDNMAKTILDVLKEKCYQDDGQVKTLLISKKIEKRVPINFAYIAIKELKDGRDVEVLTAAGVERSVTLFQELKKQGVL